ncbi:response regulator [Cohnella lubricantis]|uniref:Response regulator n=1 Tax=Cohnella lubricantis TaxID=2163172 RepID=A0A841TE48_9BACL|nr:response regulator [Cohnella lubricantis]MBB6678516.1 response regulator [Cohnella lubricantis]MBP2118439.1 YesN/AraC family two-component response regulator [Cohnella lubricantis]
MYRVLIVDDEPEIRLGLRLKIDAEQLSLELAGEAGNGIEALKLLEEKSFDIVLTDMSMPAMDGVRFMEACRSRYPEARLIVITGYEDFQYARAALRHQAIDYLLKPVARDELAAALRRAASELDARKAMLDTRTLTQQELVQLYAGQAARQRNNEPEDGELSLIEAVRRYIDDNYMSDLNLTEIAERFNYNPSYFSEMFKNKVGRTFIQYLTDARMAQAVRLLEGTQLNLWDIAELTGFSNASYFSSKFKKRFGMTPSDYRQKASGKFDNEVPKK